MYIRGNLGNKPAFFADITYILLKNLTSGQKCNPPQTSREGDGSSKTSGGGL